MSRQAVAQVLGQALIDPSFAEALQKNPTTAANSIGVHLGPNETSAVKEIQHTQIASLASQLRSKLGPEALLDVQQQQVARMD